MANAPTNSRVPAAATSIPPMPAPQVDPTTDTAPKKKLAKLAFPKLQLAEYKRSIHSAEPNDGVTADEMLEPSFWCDVSQKLRPMDRIEALAADGSWFAEFIVLNSGRLWAKVEMLRYVELKANAEVSGADPEFDIVWRNPHHKYGVVRRADKVVLKEDLQTKEEAARWLQEHLQSLTR